VNYYYLTDEGELAGPYSHAELKDFAKTGYLPLSTQVCLEGQESLHPLSEIIASPASEAAVESPPAVDQRLHSGALVARFEHSVVVLRFKEKGFTISRKDVLQGLADESAAQLRELGNDGWELVAVLPYSTGSVGFLSNAPSATDSALAFFKRAGR